MTHRVIVTAGAEQDLAAIHRYLALEAGRAEADALLDRLATRGASLADFPDRGTPVDLPVDLSIGGVRVRSVPIPPYRLFYEGGADTVTIFAILHTRRDLAALLEERRGR